MYLYNENRGSQPRSFGMRLRREKSGNKRLEVTLKMLIFELEIIH